MVQSRVGDFSAFLGETFDEATGYVALQRAGTIGRPIGAPEGWKGLERTSCPALRPQKAGTEAANNQHIIWSYCRCHINYTD